ncbi:MAG TPA: hypothetical protein VGN82_06685 [Bosea sp. (in: a-proteobacteria)]|jgi:hypothetical protein|uniref:hypothetical protein n=1 Tax=Bosea sp. (in: a-proteobacteria) TaxID=1871050 RepID=UPI002E0E8C1E|nr:hypothetical protein [Bosea sp. (in: a-proteobacteria)]
MKVTMKRHIAGTVPRKLELVNVSCVWRHTGSERSIVVSQDRAAIHTSFLPGSGAAEMPPFWELEALIDQGFELDLALNVMAARRLQTPPPLSVASLAQTSEMRLDLTPAHQ